MTRDASALDRTTLLQGKASDPAASAWVSANAGSGKTYVLSRRVIRLLLAGANPSKILCLTFTKAAAAEMTRRVFDLLSHWTECDDATLHDELAELEGTAPTENRLVHARRLFAQALETPGGLKIQTIHAFCEALLQRFPLEANVPGHFRVLDERDQSELIEAARASVFAEAPLDPSGRVGAAFTFLVDTCSDLAIANTLNEIIAQRHAVRSWIQRTGSVDEAIHDLCLTLDLTPDITLDKLNQEIATSSFFSDIYIENCMQVLARGGKTDTEVAARLGRFVTAGTDADKATHWVNIFLTKSGAWRSTNSMITKVAKADLPDFTERAEREVFRLEALLDRRRALAATQLTGAFLDLGTAVLDRYERRKTSRGFLDFEDLIVNTIALLSSAEAALWVQYKLDQGIDHILVDEAQDTSGRQWAIVEALSGEYYAGETGRPDRRTVFAVGDEKQSIYSFQGAEPKFFADMRRHFEKRAGAAGALFHFVPLRLSFRSTQDVLGAVDAVFEDTQTARGLSSDGEPILHEAVRSGEPGDVRVWPMFTDRPAAEPDDWSKPIDVENPQSAKIRLADAIADQIGTWLDSGARLAAGGPAIGAGDILVLVRKRDAFVPALVRALKTRGIPVAGSDRLALTDHIAVKDLIALGQVMVLRDDDLALATVLKGPLFDWSEEALFDIAYERTGSLWQSLEDRAAQGDQLAAPALARLRAWMNSADFERPFGFYTRVLDQDGGRRRFKARFGSEVDDVLDQFTQRALDAQVGEPVSLDRFLAGLQAADIVIKRELDTARSDIRIMTVHGAKGLESPIVFLVDPGSAPRHASHDPAIVTLEGQAGIEGPPLCVARTPEGIASKVRERLDASREAGLEEYKRLLYVALTRARDRLIVCGYQGTRGADAQCWHRLVWQGLAGDARAVPFDEADGSSMLVWQKTPALDGTAPVSAPAPEPGPPPLPDWIDRPAPAARPLHRLSPSTALDGDPDEPGPKTPARDRLAEAMAPDGDALQRGRFVHRLLEILPTRPSDERRDLALRTASLSLPDLPDDERTALVNSVLDLITEPDFAELFSDQGEAEVSIGGRVAKADGSRHLVSGQVDRLLVLPDRVTIIDYKTNRSPPQTPDAVPRPYVAQMALYREILRSIYPGREIEALLLWTANRTVSRLPGSQLDEAMRTIRES
ncbi:MAG: double-strand break repair helicase AddA [Pseudomonadota bacterium]